MVTICNPWKLKTKDSWQDIVPKYFVAKTFYIFVVVFLKVMTNGRFVSVRHRALTNSCKPRISIAFFGAPPLQARIAAPPEMVAPNRQSLYRPFTWAEYKKKIYSLRLGDSRLDLFRTCSDGGIAS